MVLLRSQLDDDGGTHVLHLRKDNARHLYDVFKTLNFREHGMLLASESGVKLIVQEMNCLQAIAYLKDDLFNSYHVDPDSTVSVRIPLNVFCECLNLLQSGPGILTAFRLVYDGEGEPLQLTMEEGGALINCSVKTQQPEPLLDFEFDVDKVVSKVIVKSEPMRDTFADLDSSSDAVEIAFDINPPRMRLSTDGELGQIETVFPGSSDLVEKFDCVAKQQNKYRLSLMKRMHKALQLSDKVSIRTDDRGLMSIQFLIIQEEGTEPVFLEFFCVPDADDYGF